MSAEGTTATPVIIKRKKITSSDENYRGAWKVAYADFVTAMMAFFLLMWLLNATTEKQRKGIADYFSPTLPISRVSGGGNGNFNGDSVFSEHLLSQNGTGASNQHPTKSRKARGDTGVSMREEPRGLNDDRFRVIEDALHGRGGDSMVSPEIRRHIITKVTDEGLIIEIFDLKDAPLFQGKSAEPTPLLKEISALIASVSLLVKNPIAIEAHTQAEPVTLAHNPVWPLSTKRAHQMRGMLQNDGIDRRRMRRITGYADRDPIADNPMSFRNNRLKIILLRSDLADK